MQKYTDKYHFSRVKKGSKKRSDFFICFIMCCFGIRITNKEIKLFSIVYSLFIIMGHFGTLWDIFLCYNRIVEEYSAAGRAADVRKHGLSSDNEFGLYKKNL